MTTQEEREKVGELRSFGRRRGRVLSARQTELMEHALPRLSADLSKPADLAALFGKPTREIWLEIGFGGGEHLVWQAQRNSDVGLIGCEPFVDGVVKVLTAIEEHQLDNIRLHADDARDLVRWLPDASIARVFVLFPDPWPKRKQQKRRLVNSALLTALVRVMKPGAELRIGTDIADYARTILMVAQKETRLRWSAQSSKDWTVRPADWPQTRYEAKAVREGRKSCYLSFARV